MKAKRSLVIAMASVLSAFSAPTLAGQVDLSGLGSADEFDQFIIKYKVDAAERKNEGKRQQGLDLAAAAISKLKGKAFGLKHKRSMSLGADVLEVDGKLDRIEAELLMRQLADNPNVEYVEVDAKMYPLLSPNDTNYSQQWGFHDADAGINAQPAWDRSTGAGVVIAVIDTGITPHSDLNANILPGYDFITSTFVSRDTNGRDSNPNDEGDWTLANDCSVGWPARNSSWHGTHVTGTIAAVTNNAKGVAGTAFKAKVVPVRVLGRCGGNMSDIADGITWASAGTVAGVPANANPAEVINMSLGGGGACGTTYQAAINGAVSRGTTVVVAAGNDNVNVSNSRPANCNNVIAVGANDSTGKRSIWSSLQQSNYGALVDVAAPGSGILSTLNTGATTQGSEGYASYNGTSMAAPHVAGVVGLIQSAAAVPKTPVEIENLIKHTTRSFPSAPDNPIGTGILDARAAVAAAVDQFRTGGDYDGDGKSDILWRNFSSGVNTIWKSANNGTQQAVSTVNNFSWRVVGIGDFDGNGKSDILWRNFSTGANTVWKDANDATQQAVAQINNFAWKAVGVGDFDGDGKSDILWRNFKTGDNTIWKSANNGTQQAVTAVDNFGWEVMGVGDFDGDGKSDILWRNFTTGANTVWKSGNNATQQAVTQINNFDWKVVGVGDFDGDGKSDILWRNFDTGENEIWKSANSATPQAVTTVNNFSWEVVGVGDFDGDGKSDILWRNFSSGANTVWKSGNDATQQAVTAVGDFAWKVVP